MAFTGVIIVKYVLVVEKYSSIEYHQNHGHDIGKLSESDRKAKQEGHYRQKKFMQECKALFEKVGIKAHYVRELHVETPLKTLPYELIITVGGDGTFLNTAHYITDQMMIGFNSDKDTSKGALTSANCENLESCIERLAKGDFETELWPRLEAYVNDKPLQNLAVNDISIAHKIWYKPSHLRIEVDGTVDKMPANCGIVVCTGMGSHAWYKSEGGTPFDNKLDAFGYVVRAPMVKEENRTISRILRLGSSIKVYPSQENYQIVVDCQEPPIDLGLGDFVEVKLSKEKGIKIVKF